MPKTYTLSIQGASSPPYNVTLSPQSASSVLLSWLPPKGSKCPFSYVVSTISNIDNVSRRTSNTSLTITNLNMPTQYQFAVAVEDTNLTTGPRSEAIDIFWSGM